MGISSYGLFGNSQPNTASFGREYELRRQLEARESQLNDLAKKNVLSEDDRKRKAQLENAVSQLSGKLNPASSKTQSDIPADKTQKTSEASKTYSEGLVIAKSACSKYAKATPTVVEEEAYLRGFFIDLRI